MTKLVLLPEPIDKTGVEYLESRDYILKYCNNNKEDIIQAVSDCDAILTRNAVINREIIEHAPRLKVIARHGVGVDIIDTEVAREKGIWVTNAPQSNTNAVAEQVVGAIIALARNLILSDTMVRAGEFSRRKEICGVELSGKVIGIVGFGRIGRLVAKKTVLGLGMQCAFFDPYAKHDDNDGFVAVKKQTLEELLACADILSLHMPLMDATRHMIKTRELKTMKKSAFLINYARGPLVALDDLLDALDNGEIAGAALDVYEDENITAQDRICSTPNLLLSPHTAAFTHESLVNMALHAAITIDEVLCGLTPRWFVVKPKEIE